jgi:O-antigen/teichoic acid export membrane protein
MVLAAPVLTRLYSPEDFGLLAVYISFVSIVAVVASLRYQLAIPLPEHEKDASAVVILCLSVVVTMSVLSGAVAWAFGDMIARMVNTSGLAICWWLVPIGVMLGGAYQVSNYWAIRERAFPLIARAKLTQAVSLVIVQAAGWGFGPVALLVGHVTSQAVGLLSLGTEVVRKRLPEFREIQLADIEEQARRFRRFPMYSSWGGLANTAGSQVPPVLFAALFSSAAAGIYTLAERALFVPVSLIGQAIAQVFISDAVAERRRGQLADLVARIYCTLAAIGMPPVLILVIAGPDLFTWIFGSSWRQAGVFSQWMAPWLYVVFIAAPLGNLSFVIEKQAQDMVFQALLLFTRFMALVIGAWKGELAWAVSLFAAGSFVCWCGFLVWILRASGNSCRLLLTATAKALGWGSLYVSPVILSYMLSEITWIRLGSLVFAGVLISSGYFVFLKHAWTS